MVFTVCFYRDSLIMAMTSLIWTLVLGRLSSLKRTSLRPLPPSLQNLLDGWIGKILCLNPRHGPAGAPVPPTSATNDNNGMGVKDDELELVQPINPTDSDWAWLAHLFDRLAFILYLILYLSLYFAFL
jgi:hypothetical protein